MISTFLRELKQRPLQSCLVLLVTTLLLLADYYTRLHVPTMAAQPVNASELQLVLPDQVPAITPNSAAWLAQLTEQIAITQQQNNAEPAVGTTELAGATRLADLQVRVRAIFIRPNASRMALIEVLAPDSAITFLPAYEDQHFGTFRLTQIAMQQLTFINTIQPGSAPVVIPLFNLATGTPEGTDHAAPN